MLSLQSHRVRLLVMFLSICFFFLLQEQVETPESNSTHSALAHQAGSDRVSNATTGPSGGEQTEDEAEDEGAVELLPPMEEIQTHPLPTSGAPTSTTPGGVTVEEDVHSKLVRISVLHFHLFVAINARQVSV